MARPESNSIPRNRPLAWGLAIAAAVFNVLGYTADLYQEAAWFDEAIHAFSLFALTYLAASLLDGVVLTGRRTHPLLFILVLVGFGLGLGAAWEVAEWAYDQLTPGNAILGKADTISDLIMDTLGALAAGALAVFRDP